MEELTWMEIRDEIAAGKTIAIVPTGGIEQSGPYLPVGKHNYILTKTMDLLANKLGNALIAPIVKYVPEGGINPRSGHMLYPGTISLREDLFVQVLKEIGKSLHASGFHYIVFLGDSGDNMRGLQVAAEELTREWSANPAARVIFVPEYYNYREITAWLAQLGFVQTPEGIHDDLAFSAELLAIDEDLVRYKERQASGKLSINSIDLRDKAKFSELGRTILERRAQHTSETIKRLLGSAK